MSPALPFALLALLAAAPSAAQDAARWRIAATLDPARGTLSVQSCSDTPQAQVRFFLGQPGAARFLLAAERGDGVALAPRDGELHAADWRAGECLRTRIDLRAAAREGGRGRGYRADGTFVLDPRRWLWRPAGRTPDSTLDFALPPGWNVSVPWPPRDASRRRYRLGPDPADGPALTAFGRFEELWLERPGGRLRIALLPPWNARERPRIEPVVDALLLGYGRLPRPDAQLLALPLPGVREAAPWGQTTRGAAAAVQLFAGADAPQAALLEDWTATHELVHLMHPHLGPRGRWLSEGLASYWQNVLRARAGVLTPEQAWERLQAGLQRGRDERRCDGLTLVQASRRAGELRCYMRVYWSGAAYWLEADLALRARGDSLDALLRRYADCCLQRHDDLAPEDFVAQLDRLAEGDVFGARHARFAALPGFPDTHTAQVPAALRAAIMRPAATPAARPP
jgi:hypothetical protein